MVLTDEFAGLCLMYQSYHSVEDKEKSPGSPLRRSGSYILRISGRKQGSGPG